MHMKAEEMRETDRLALTRLLAERYSCRAFRPDPVPRATIEAIQEIGKQLAQFFPRAVDDVNELPDRPEIVDN